MKIFYFKLSAFNNQMMGSNLQQSQFDATNMPPNQQPNLMGDLNQMNQMNQINQQQQQDLGAFSNQQGVTQQLQKPADQSLQQQKPKDMFCPLCRISILMPSSELENKCFDCAQVVCKNCGINTQSQFNEKIWLCVNCVQKNDQMKFQQQQQQQQPLIQQTQITDQMNLNQPQMPSSGLTNVQMQPQQQLGQMQDSLTLQQQPFNEQMQIVNDIDAINQQQQNKMMMDPMLSQQSAIDQQQPLRDPVTGQSIFNQQPNMIDSFNQINKMDMNQQQQQLNPQFDPITGLPINQSSQLNALPPQQQLDFNKPQIMGPYDPMNQQIDPLTGLPFNQNKQFNEINNNTMLSVGDKMKQQGSQYQPNQLQQPIIDPLSTMQNTVPGLYLQENGM